MGKNCEQIRQLLVELEYGELDAMDANAVQAHLEECASCATRQAAYGAVRADLRSWDDVEPAPSRVTFVAMQRRPATAGWRRSTKGLAVAASFLMGFLLTAAMANIRITRADGAWSLSTSLWPATESGTGTVPDGQIADPAVVRPTAAIPVGTANARPAASPAQPPAGGFMVEADLERWLDDRLRARGLHPDQGGSVASFDRAQLLPVIEQLMTERDAQVRSLVRQIIAASEQRQRQEFDAALSGLYQTFDVQRTNDLLFLAGEFGLMQENTGIELQRTNAAVDFLLTRVANDDRQPEQRDRDE